MRQYSRKIIGIILGYEEVKRFSLNDTIKISEIPNRFGFERFNPAHAHVMGIQSDDYEGRIAIGFTHPEFVEIPEVQRIPEYYIEDARSLFPYLFVETNPLLYRNFGYGHKRKVPVF